MRRLSALVIGTSLCTLTLAFAGDQPAAMDTGHVSSTSLAADQRFDSHIDSWVRGEIASLDIANNKMSIKGVNMPFATASAKMLRELHDRTADLTDPEAKQKKETEIRQSWQAKLDSAATEAPGTESTYNLRIPAKETVAVMNSDQVANVDFLRRDKDLALTDKNTDQVVGAPVINGQHIDTAAGVTKQDAQPATDAGKLALSDLKVGEHVKVGYDSGLINSDVYAIVKCDK
jgi:hypothetical protein